MTIKFKYWIVPIALLFSGILDGMFSYHLSSIVNSGSLIVPVNLMLIGFVLLNLVYDDNVLHIYLAFGLGLILDLLYLGFVGANFLFLPLMTFVIRLIAKAIPTTFFDRLMTVLIVDVLWNLYQFFIFNFFGVASIGVKSLFFEGILPSVIVTIVLFSLTYNFWVNLIIKYPFYRD